MSSRVANSWRGEEKKKGEGKRKGRGRSREGAFGGDTCYRRSGDFQGVFLLFACKEAFEVWTLLIILTILLRDIFVCFFVWISGHKICFYWSLGWLCFGCHCYIMIFSLASLKRYWLCFSSSVRYLKASSPVFVWTPRSLHPLANPRMKQWNGSRIIVFLVFEVYFVNAHFTFASVLMEWVVRVALVGKSKMSDSSRDLIVSIVGVCFLSTDGSGSGESWVSDEPSCPENLNRWLQMFSG